jgi:hypothetical protein
VIQKVRDSGVQRRGYDLANPFGGSKETSSAWIRPKAKVS